MTFLKANLHWVCAGLVVAVILGMGMRPPKQEGRIDLSEFAKIPVVADGRMKPIDTEARTALRVISGQDSITVAKNDERSALQWFMEVISAEDIRTSPVWKYKVFRITSEQVLGMLELKPREGFRYSLDEISGNFEKLNKEAIRAKDLQKQGHELDLFERETLRLRENLEGFLRVAQRQEPLVISPTADSDWQSYSRSIDAIVAALPSEVVNKEKVEILAGICHRLGVTPDALGQLPAEARQRLLNQVDEEIERRAEIALSKTTPSNEFEAAVARGMNSDPAAKAWNSVLAAYRSGDKEEFSKAVASYQATETSVTSKDRTKAVVEEAFNRFSPFYWCTGLYVIAALLICASWLGWTTPLQRTADSIIVLTFIVHFVGLCVRMYLQGRPPVTNLYSSAIFIGLGCVFMGLILERIWPIGVGNLIGSTLGFLTTIIAHNLGSDRDTLEMMQAVLDTNFWLSTHVTMVTTGYMATFVTGFIGMIFILRGVLTPSLDAKAFKSISQMLYGVLCFATFASFTGTVLGGIWADQAWGRFWGWDSKENGAVLVVIWNAIILHARWAGLIKQRGMAVMAVGGNIMTAWSWFGTNMLGVGLHSYGFMDQAVPFLVGFWISQFVVMGIGIIPTDYWRSFGVRPPTWPTEPPASSKPRARPLVAVS
jgi:ABC-type transport system involved in cytochrome c biogenesis permease subunit